jgi:pimeloyl-ACP methyl ester carboxylesterase
VPTGELCRFASSDGLELSGFLASPASQASDVALVHAHGLAGNFYENSFIDVLADYLTGLGLSFLTFNNRGHDYIADVVEYGPDAAYAQSRRMGGAYELFGECEHDIAGAIAFCRSKGSKAIILQGHSNGAAKVAYYASRHADPDVIGLVLLSPSDDMALQRQNLGNRYETVLKEARKRVKEGRGWELMPRGSFGYPMSAATYVDSFDSGAALGLFNLAETDRNSFPELNRISLPVLLALGTVGEGYLGTAEDYQTAIRTQMSSAKGFEGIILEGAPHNYRGHDEALSRGICDWTTRLLGEIAR